jgi:hypothetical protein
MLYVWAIAARVESSTPSSPDINVKVRAEHDPRSSFLTIWGTDGQVRGTSARVPKESAHLSPYSRLEQITSDLGIRAYTPTAESIAVSAGGKDNRRVVGQYLVAAASWRNINIRTNCSR